jgi:hypothetical protein
MAMLYAVGDALVSHEELSERRDSVRDFSVAIADGGVATLELSTGEATHANVITRGDGASGAPEPNPFTPVGLGKPLAIEIRYVYTGEYPHRVLFDRTKDLLVTSAVKGLVSYDAAPRAVNFLRKDVGRNAEFATPEATEQGTPLVFYVPALTQSGTVATFEMVFDDFPRPVFDQISGAFTSAAAIPLFASKSALLLGAGSLIKLAGKAGEALFDAHPEFRASESVVFQRPGGLDSVADFRVITRSAAEAGDLAGYRVDTSGQLVHKTDNTPYNGDHPYMVISLDGREVKEYESFTPTAASAALLDRFFGIGEGRAQPADMLIDALKLYNDWKYRNRADVLQGELKKLDPGSDAFTKKKAEYDALVKNILSDVMKPS